MVEGELKRDRVSKLPPDGWVIHHLNGIPGDNRPDNLVARPRGQHISQVEPYRERIRQLEVEVVKLREALEQNQLIFIPN